MHSEALLTQDELDFIQQLTAQPPPGRPSATPPTLALGEQLSAMISLLGDEQPLSLDTYSGAEHLRFPLLVIQEGSGRSRLELGPPKIFEPGSLERPWRLALLYPLALLDSTDRPSGMMALELSNNGMLVRHNTPGSPVKERLLQLLLPEQRRVQLRASLVRRVGQGRYAYSIQPLHEEDEQTLREYLFEQHKSQQHPTAATI